MELTSADRPSAHALSLDAKRERFGCGRLAGCTCLTSDAAAATTSETFMVTLNVALEGQLSRPALERPGLICLR